MFSKQMSVTKLLLLDKLASEIIAPQADFTSGFCKISALTCSRGISLTNPELYCYIQQQYKSNFRRDCLVFLLKGSRHAHCHQVTSY